MISERKIMCRREMGVSRWIDAFSTKMMAENKISEFNLLS